MPEGKKIVAPKNIAIIRLSSMGDVALTYTAVCALRLSNPDAMITYITSRPFLDVIKDWKGIDKILIYGEYDFKLIEPGAFDWIIDLHKNKKSAWLLGRLKAPKVTRLIKLNSLKWLNVNIKSDYKVSHITHRCEEAAGNTLPNHHLLPPANDYKLETNDRSSPKQVAIILGAAHATKVPTQRVLTALISNISEQIILIGGKQEQAFGEKLAIEYPHVTNYAGKLTIEESIAKIKASLYCIGADTGMSHIAAMNHIPLLMIWSSTHVTVGMKPVNPLRLNVDLEKELSCRPCTKLGRGACPLGHYECMNHSDSAIKLALAEMAANLSRSAAP